MQGCMQITLKCSNTKRLANTELQISVLLGFVLNQFHRNTELLLCVTLD